MDKWMAFLPSLRSKRFRRAFRSFEPLAFWPRENWGERKEMASPAPPPPSIFCARPNFRAAKKRSRCLERTEKAYGNACYTGYILSLSPSEIAGN